MNQRVVLLGLDGADQHSLGAAIDADRMPTLARLVHGELRPLRSTPLPITPAAWTAAYTGMNPGKTGVLTWERPRESYRKRLVNSSDVGTLGFHTRAAERGKRILSVGFPMMSPPPQVEGGVYLAGWDSSPEVPLCNDSAWLNKLGGFGYTLDAEFTTDETQLAAGIRSRFAILRALAAERPWDCAMIYLGFIDTLGHRLGFGNDLTLRMLSLVDQELKTFLDTVAGPYAFLTCSDHGFGQFPRVFSVQQWLEHEGFLSLRTREYRANEGAIRSVEVMDLESGMIEWERTQAFCTEAIGGFAAIALNLKGSYARGTVAPKEAFATSSKIIDALRAAKDPTTGEPIIAHTWRREELFWGPHVAEFPEIFLETVPDTAAYVGKRKHTEGGYRLEDGFVHRGAFNSHLADGIIGASFEIAPRTATVEDIAPTVYTLLGLPVPSDVDGENLSTANATVEELAAVGAPAPFSHEEEEIVRKRLEDLGYLG